MTEPLSAFSGNTLYLDTTVLYALLRGIELGAQTLFARIESGELKAYTQTNSVLKLCTEPDRLCSPNGDDPTTPMRP